MHYGMMSALWVGSQYVIFEHFSWALGIAIIQIWKVEMISFPMVYDTCCHLFGTDILRGPCAIFGLWINCTLLLYVTYQFWSNGASKETKECCIYESSDFSDPVKNFGVGLNIRSVRYERMWEPFLYFNWMEILYVLFHGLNKKMVL